MARAGRRDPLRLAILLGSIAGLVVLGARTAGGPSGASASRRAAARDRNPGRVVATTAQGSLPLDLRHALPKAGPPGVATVRASRATYLLGGTRTAARGTRVPVASVLLRTGRGPAERVAKLPVPVSHAVGALVGDQVYALGGELAGGRPSDLVQEYDVATERSVVAARLPEPVTDTAALTLGGFVYLVGGRVRGSPTRAIVRFDPLRGTAAVAGRLPVPASGGVGVASSRRCGYLVGANVRGSAPLDFGISVGCRRPRSRPHRSSR